MTTWAGGVCWRCFRFRPSRADDEDDQDLLSEVAELDDLAGEVLVEIVQLAKPPRHAVVPQEDSRLSLEGLLSGRVVLDIWVRHREDALQVSSKDRQMDLADQLDVVLRRRLTGIGC